MSEERLYIKGKIQFTIFENAAEHFSIAKVKILETNEAFDESEIIMKGYFANLHEDTSYVFYGKLIEHPKYGTQYDVNSFETYVPKTKDGLINYLSSDLFPGIGERLAQSIIEAYGDNVINKILKEPEKLKEIPRLSQKAADNMVKTIQENQGFEQIVIELAKYDIGLKLAQEIFNVYKEESIVLLQTDPYTFVFEIDGFGFKTADKIGRLNEIPLNHPTRIGAAIIFALERQISEGHVYYPKDLLINDALEILNTMELTIDDIKHQLDELHALKKIYVEENRIYLISLYYAETGFVSHLNRILEDELTDSIVTADLYKITGEIEEAEKISYGEEQFNAIHRSLDSKIMILTGGPGTGKTTVIKGIVKAYAAHHELSLDMADYKSASEYPFVLTAPTGRAAKRLQESTGIRAVTIHRLLGWDGGEHFDKNEYEQLTGKFLIIDEFSMVDIWLANQLFKAIPSDMQVLLVGDEDQLPSVGPGQVLSDLLRSNKIPLTTLDEVYRQKSGSQIIDIAHKIKQNKIRQEDILKGKDFSFIQCETHQVISVIKQIITLALEKGLDADEIQVLAPMYKSQAGINQINQSLQALINPKEEGKREIKVFEKFYRVGDRVLQLVNQPEDGVSNGDIGKIVAIFKANENVEKKEQIIVEYDDIEVMYTRNEYQNITHAYCISIHKSQGSEFQTVILPVVSAYNRMLRKNLLYTGMTRAQESLILCGEENAFFRGLETVDVNLRYTALNERLTMEKTENQEIEERKVEGTGLYLPIDDGLSPYDFM